MRQLSGAHDENGLHRDTLYIAARAPRPGFTKSRLGRAIGHDAAARLYAAFVRDLAARFSRAPFRVGWYVTPEDAWDELAPLMPAAHSWGGGSGPVLLQPPGDWAERQCQLFSTAHLRQERRTILVASDSPHLGLETIVEAFARLDRADLVLGPTTDGGYYLVGMRSPAAHASVRTWSSLAGVRMSTRSVLDEIVACAAGLGLHTDLLAPTFDIDEAADLEHLIPLVLRRDDLAATRDALYALGLMPVQACADQPFAVVLGAAGGAR